MLVRSGKQYWYTTVKLPCSALITFMLQRHSLSYIPRQRKRPIWAANDMCTHFAFPSIQNPKNPTIHKDQNLQSPAEFVYSRMETQLKKNQIRSPSSSSIYRFNTFEPLSQHKSCPQCKPMEEFLLARIEDTVSCQWRPQQVKISKNSHHRRISTWNLHQRNRCNSKLACPILPLAWQTW